MPRNIPARLILALLLTTALIDLQLYVHRFLPPKDMLGQYLRKQIEQPPCGQLLATGTARKCKAPNRDV